MGPVNTSELLQEAFGRIHPLVVEAVDGRDAGDLAWRPDEEANSIGWLVWHLLRVQDDHVAEGAGTEQGGTSRGWYDRFGRPVAPQAQGYGMSSEEVGQVVGVGSDDLRGYAEDVVAATEAYVG